MGNKCVLSSVLAYFTTWKLRLNKLPTKLKPNDFTSAPPSPPGPSSNPWHLFDPAAHSAVISSTKVAVFFLDFFTLVLFIFTFISLLPLYKCLLKLVRWTILLVLEHAVNIFYAINLSKKNPALWPHGVFRFRIIFTTTSNYFPKQH